MLQSVFMTREKPQTQFTDRRVPGCLGGRAEEDVVIGLVRSSVSEFVQVSDNKEPVIKATYRCCERVNAQLSGGKMLILHHIMTENIL